MQIFKKEKHARKLALEHFALTRDCLENACKTLQEYLEGDLEGARATASQVREIESEADELKRTLRRVLYSGAFLPNIRSDVFRVVDAVDTVADKGESVAKFLVNQEPDIPGSIHQDLLGTFRMCTECYEELRNGLKCFFKPKGEIEALQQHVTRVGELETDVDRLEADLTRRIFQSSMEMGEKLHLSRLLERIADIADAAEDAADELQSSAMKAVL
jgi:predicted phosphate transport protein (TIGR00153 family)